MTTRRLDFGVDVFTLNQRPGSVFVAFASLQYTEAVAYCFSDQVSLVEIPLSFGIWPAPLKSSSRTEVEAELTECPY